MKDRFIANKFGLFNFWYYDFQEFKLNDGKVIFRGSNGSGKSVTTQSFVPLLFDGDKRPHRIDPFQSKARKIENYLLMDEHDEDKISYLYIEFKKPSSKTYITIGMGLRARKSKDLESWYFIIHDSKRINKDLNLYKTIGKDKYALTKKEFKNLISKTSNFFTEKSSEYMKKVNEYLFGYSDIEEYKELLNLLIELRSPKLSKDFKPTVIYNILEKSLSTLDDDDLRPISDAMDAMDDISNKINNLEKTTKSLYVIKDYFDKYNLEVFYRKAKNFKEKEKEVKSIQNSIDEINKLNIEIKESIKYREDEIFNLKLELESAKIKEKSLSQNEAFNIRESITLNEIEKEKLENDLAKKEKSLDNKIDSKNSLKESIEKVKHSIYKKEKELFNLFDDEDYLKNESYFLSSQNINKSNYKEFCFSILFNEIREYDNLISTLYNNICEYGHLNIIIDDLKNKIYSQNKNINYIQSTIERNKSYLTNIKNETCEKIDSYLLSTEFFKISKENIEDIKNSIYEIYYVGEYSKVNDILKNIYYDIKEDINKNLIQMNHDKKNLNSKVKEIKKNIEILESDEIDITKNKFLENIDYEVFYKTVNFKENVDYDTKIIIEKSLLQMGILESFIIPSKFNGLLLDNDCNVLFGLKNKLCDYCLQKDDLHTKNNLLHYLELEKSEFNEKYKDEVKSILSSISINEEKILKNITSQEQDFKNIETNSKSNKIEKCSINIENKNFKLGILDGFISNEYSLKYIGYNSRKLYKENQIKILKSELEVIETNLKDLDNNIKELKDKEKNLKTEFDNFPNDNDINASIKLIEEELNKLNKEENLLFNFEKLYVEEKEKFEKIKIKVFEESVGVNIPKNKESFKEAMKNLSSYKETIFSIEKNINFINQKENEVNSLECRLNDVISYIDENYFEVKDIKEKIDLISNKINSLNEVIYSLNLGELESNLKALTLIINTYPQKIHTLDIEKAKYETKLENNKSNIEDKNNILLLQNKLLDVYLNVLKDEIDLKYISEIKDFEYIEAINWIIKNHTSINLNNIQKKLNDSISEANLNDYNIIIKDLFSDYIEDEFKQIYESSIRIDIKFKFNKKETSIYELIEILNLSLSNNKLLIDDKEREVFEEILINTLSAKISARISKASKWVKDINSLMDKMETSNKLKLNLKWVTKDTDYELSTKNLIDALKSHSFMSSEKRKEIAHHFREKLKDEKRKDDTNKSYFQLIKNILDYRQWYEFKLLFSNETVHKRELTDNKFFAFSGGEKAMSMYIPLFAAVNARYNLANPDSPRIIALDEAFAGVDENNISNLFELIESLNLDYVLNSQVLWGTYKSVKNISIYELIRNGNDFVVPIKYTWNGFEKNMEI